MAKKKYSSFVTNGTDKAPNRAMLRAVGFENDDFNLINEDIYYKDLITTLKEIKSTIALLEKTIFK